MSFFDVFVFIWFSNDLRNVRFSEHLTCFVFLKHFSKHPFWDSPFCLITDETCYWFISESAPWENDIFSDFLPKFNIWYQPNYSKRVEKKVWKLLKSPFYWEHVSSARVKSVGISENFTLFPMKQVLNIFFFGLFLVTSAEMSLN